MIPGRELIDRARKRPAGRGVSVVAALLALIGSLLVAPSAAAAPATVDTGVVRTAAVVGFNAENIISDALFYDSKAMTAAQIQSFLDGKIGTCTNGKCLNVLSTSISNRDAVTTGGNTVCTAIKGGTMRVSELIYRVQTACGISAKVILVTLQKEQGLVTSKAPSDWALRAAMGASCPDTAPCDPAYSGIGPQLVQGVKLMKTYRYASWAKKPGSTWIGYNPSTSCGGTTLNIRNWATAALYTYTPYQPNKAALAAGFGLGDSCSAYGNRNFYSYYTSWFGSTTAGVSDPCQVPSDSSITAGSGAFVTTTALNGRAAPSTSCANVLEVLPGNAVVIKTGEYGSWWRVQRNGATRWVSKDYLKAVPATGTAFVDVSASSSSPVYTSFHADIAWLRSSGISAGWTVNGSVEFRPGVAVTRDVMAAFLYRAAGSPDFAAPSSSPFTDVSVGNVFFREITWLAASGISAGWAAPGGGTEFRPTAPVTRDVMAAFLYRVAGSPAYTAPRTSAFTDVGVGHVFYKEISWLAANGISNGWAVTGGNEYRAAIPVTRDVMAAFLRRLHVDYLNIFTDVAAMASSPMYSVFATDIAWIAATGISKGWPVANGSEYRPGSPVTRDVMAAFLYRAAGSPAFTPPKTSPFADVPVGYVFYKEIAWLASSGISTGWVTNGRAEFRPGASVTRDVMAAFLYRAAGRPAFTPSRTSPFADVSTANVFYKEISWMQATKISEGWLSGSVSEYRPYIPVTRDVMAAFLQRHRAHQLG